ncbi:MAG: hypothetical protein GY875_22725, partial [Gammaproteobacteria bacterium]|nr:hypothetical protein [Gammaproteobacteria bacterium]
RGVERLQHDGAFFGRQPGANHEAAVVIIVIGQLTGSVLRRGALAFFEAPDMPIGAYQLFDLCRGGVTSEFEQFGFVLRVGDPGYGAQLGKAELTGGKRCRDQW